MGDLFERYFSDTQPKSDRLLARWVGTRRFSAPARHNLTRLACERFAGFLTGSRSAGFPTCRIAGFQPADRSNLARVHLGLAAGRTEKRRRSKMRYSAVSFDGRPF